MAKETKNISTKRAVTTPEMRREACRYYLMGLTLPEISKLLDGVSVRTLEKWQTLDEWTKLKQPENIKKKVMDLKNAGMSFEIIGKKIGISKATAYRYAKQYTEENH